MKNKRLNSFILDILIFTLTVSMLLPAGLKSGAEDASGENGSQDVSASETSTDDAVETAVDAENVSACKAAIQKAAIGFEESVNVSKFGIPSEYAEKVYLEALFDAPEIYYVDYSKSASSFVCENGILKSVSFTYICDEQAVGQTFFNYRNASQRFVSKDDYENLTDAEKYLLAFESIVANTKKAEYNSEKATDYVSTLYGVLNDGVADSLGYALAFKYYSNMCGLEAYVVESDSGEYWNAAKLGDSYFYVDVYNADVEEDDLSVLYGDDINAQRVSQVSHVYFMGDLDMFELLNHEEGNVVAVNAVEVTETGSVPCKNFWNNITSNMVYHNGLWYAISPEAANKIIARSAVISSATTVAEVTATPTPEVTATPTPEVTATPEASDSDEESDDEDDYDEEYYEEEATPKPDPEAVVLDDSGEAEVLDYPVDITKIACDEHYFYFMLWDKELEYVEFGYWDNPETLCIGTINDLYKIRVDLIKAVYRTLYVDKEYVEYYTNGFDSSLEDTYIDADKEGWNETADGRFYIVSGQPLSGIQTIAGETYYFSGITYCATGGKVVVTDENNTGVLANGTYYFGDDGKLLETGLCTIDGVVYLISDGKPATGLVQVDSKFYYAKSDGTLASGLVKISYAVANKAGIADSSNSAAYYLFGSDGALVDSTFAIWPTDGEVYYIMYGRPYAAGMIMYNAKLYYVNSHGQASSGAVYVSSSKLNGLLSSAGKYYFAENGAMVENDFIELSGVRYYITNGQRIEAGLIEYNGEIYYINSKATASTGSVTVMEAKLNGLLPSAGTYFFTADGSLADNEFAEYTNGLSYYFVNGKKNAAGMVLYSGYYYYVNSKAQASTGNLYVAKSKLNGLLKTSGYYLFDENGALVDKKIAEYTDGQMYYFEMGKKCIKGLTKLGGKIYYINTKARVSTGNVMITEDKLNGILETAGTYFFKEDGALADNEFVDTYYYAMGKKSAAGVVEINGEIYYINGNYQAVTTSVYISSSKLNGLLPSAGRYYFGSNGVILDHEFKTLGDGKTYFFINGKCAAKGIYLYNENVLYIAKNGQIGTGTVEITDALGNGILSAGTYSFDANGYLVEE